MCECGCVSVGVHVSGLSTTTSSEQRLPGLITNPFIYLKRSLLPLPVLLLHSSPSCQCPLRFTPPLAQTRACSSPSRACSWGAHPTWTSCSWRPTSCTTAGVWVWLCVWVAGFGLCLLAAYCIACVPPCHPDFEHKSPSTLICVLLCPPPPCSPSGLVSRLKMMGMRVCAFGWQPQGPQRELIESSGVDGFLMGPIHPQVRACMCV